MLLVSLVSSLLFITTFPSVPLIVKRFIAYLTFPSLNLIQNDSLIVTLLCLTSSITPDFTAMVYQGKPSAGCQNCRKRKIKVRSRSGFIQATRSLLNPVSPLVSATRLSQPALNASTPRGNALATLPVSTWSCVTRRKRSGGRLNGRSSYRTKPPNFPHHLNPHRPKSPRRRLGRLLTREKMLPVR